MRFVPCLLITASLVLFAEEAPVLNMCAFAQPPSSGALSALDDDCVKLNEVVRTRVANGQLQEAAVVLREAWKHASAQPRTDCAGVTFTNLAAVMLNSGRLAEAEELAEKAVNTLANIHGPEDPIVLRPLQILCAARLEKGELGSARQAFQRMQRIPVQNSHDRALLHGMAASICIHEGNDRQAEADYLAAISASEQAGENQGADFAVLIEGLGRLYIRQKRFEDARQAFDRALAIFRTAKDTVPLDFIIFLDVRAELHMKLSEWSDADIDLTRALRLGTSAPHWEPALSESLFRSYAVVLRNTHRRRKARHFETEADAVHAHPRQVVDVSELLSR